MIPTEFKGKVYFYWWTECGGHLMCSRQDDLGGEYILLGESDELHVTFDANESTAKAVAAIDKQIENVKAAKVYEISKLETAKAELLALGNEVAA